jgi:thiol-disulfide isomerase/thioredoxin
MRSLPLIAALLALAACQQQAEQQPQSNDTASAQPTGVKGVHRENAGKPAPDKQFNDPEGQLVGLADFKGQPVLVNLWASWCAPCVKELPTLDKLAATGRIKVLAVSQDSGPHPSVVAFLDSHKLANLDAYQDPDMGLSGALGPETVLPTTILIGADGKEIWRYVGDLDWTSVEAAKLLAEAGESPKAG